MRSPQTAIRAAAPPSAVTEGAHPGTAQVNWQAGVAVHIPIAMAAADVPRCRHACRHLLPDGGLLRPLRFPRRTCCRMVAVSSAARESVLRTPALQISSDTCCCKMGGGIAVGQRQLGVGGPAAAGRQGVGRSLLTGTTYATCSSRQQAAGCSWNAPVHFHPARLAAHSPVHPSMRG